MTPDSQPAKSGSVQRDLSWGADCEGCEERMNAGRAHAAAEVAGDGPLLCGSCRDEAKAQEVREALEALTAEVGAMFANKDYSGMFRAWKRATEVLNG